MATNLRSAHIFLRTHSKTLVHYGRSRPHFAWHLSIVAIVSVVLVSGVMALSTAAANNTRNLLMETSGAQSLSAEQLTDLVAKEKLLAYWLGPISGSTYTLVANTSGKVTVSYLSGGRGIDDPSKRNLVIDTSGVGVLPGAILSGDSEFTDATDSTVTGNTFSYDRSLADHMTVQVKADGCRVFIGYPQIRSSLTMQTDAEALVKIG